MQMPVLKVLKCLNFIGYRHLLISILFLLGGYILLNNMTLLATVGWLRIAGYKMFTYVQNNCYTVSI